MISIELKKWLYLKYPKSEGWEFKVRKEHNTIYSVYILKAPYKFDDNNDILYNQGWFIGYSLKPSYNADKFDELIDYIDVFKSKHHLYVTVFQGGPNKEKFIETNIINKMKLL